MGDKFVRIIKSSQITEIVRDMCIKANIYLGEDVVESLKENKELQKKNKCLYVKILEWLYFL